MQYTINQTTDGEDELILNYTEHNREVDEIITYMEKRQCKLIGKLNGETVLFSPDQVLYIEKVDDKTFAYTEDKVIQLDMPLSTIELVLGNAKCFRCSKSMIVNINMVERLKSLPSNRIDATMINGEHIMISRTYASELRRYLRGE